MLLLIDPECTESKMPGDHGSASVVSCHEVEGIDGCALSITVCTSNMAKKQSS
jgi:hypothetical protein